MSNGTTEQLDNIQAWPLLVSEVDGYTTSGGGGTTAGGSLNAVVERSLRGILGWRPRKSDPKGLLAALNQSFSLKPADGRDTWTWTPHSYHVPADAGAVTGAQASLYKMAKVAWEQSRPLLDGLQALCDKECLPDVEAIRAIITSEFSELVNEFGHVGGPRPQRVDTLLISLLASAEENTDPTVDDCHLKDLKEKLGLDLENVNTIDEEQNLTNYLVLVGYALSVRHSWVSQKASLTRLPGSKVFLGTQTIRLSWELAAMGESAQHVREVMESMYINESSRRTLPIRRIEGGTMTLDEVVQWAEYVANEEGPRLIREAGKAGIRALAPTLGRLAGVLDNLFDTSRSRSSNPLPQVHSPRAMRAIQELQSHAHQAYDLAQEVDGGIASLTLTLAVTGGGKVHSVAIPNQSFVECLANDVVEQKYDKNDEVNLIAIPVADFEFDGWTVDGLYIHAEPQLVLPMREDRTVDATFVPIQYTLSVQVVGEGKGTVTVQGIPTPIQNGPAQIFNLGTRSSLTLTAEPEVDNRFAGWEIDGVLKPEYVNPLAVEVNGPVSIVAIFESNPEVNQVNLAGVAPQIFTATGAAAQDVAAAALTDFSETWTPKLVTLLERPIAQAVAKAIPPAGVANSEPELEIIFVVVDVNGMEWIAAGRDFPGGQVEVSERGRAGGAPIENVSTVGWRKLFPPATGLKLKAIPSKDFSFVGWVLPDRNAKSDSISIPSLHSKMRVIAQFQSVP